MELTVPVQLTKELHLMPKLSCIALPEKHSIQITPILLCHMPVQITGFTASQVECEEKALVSSLNSEFLSSGVSEHVSTVFASTLTFHND